MITAARLLRDSKLTVEAIARRVGYTSSFAFSNAFKRSLGHPPGSYRQLISSAQGSAINMRSSRERHIDRSYSDAIDGTSQPSE
jgi:AraC-like DNA-binding protein